MGMMKGLAGGLVLLLSIAAHAQSASETEQLRKHFEDGSKAFNLGEFKHAVDEYKAAYNIRPDPVFLYNIAQAYRLDGNLQQALFFYKSYLTNSPKAPNRRECESRIRDLEQQIAAQRAVTSAPPTGTQPPSGIIVEPPRTEAPKTEPPKVEAPKPEPPKVESAPSLVVTAPPPEKKTPVYKKWWLWTAVGVVAVGAALGAGLAVGLQSNTPSSALGATRVF
jgi:tetratricopeptide (TPR) repeat protein